MYLRGAERSQRAQLIFGGDPDPAGHSPRAKLCQGTWPGSRAESARAPAAAVTLRRGARTRRRQASRGEDAAQHGRLPATRRSVPYQPNEL